MRILHTSDWHIGRTFHGASTLAAVREVLAALVAQVGERGVDLVIVAGDVFDSATPAADCYAVLSDTLAGLADTGARVVVTSGNHDSAARLGFQAALLRPGVHVLTDPATVGEPVTVDDPDGPVRVYGIPYLEPSIVRHAWGAPGIRSQADAMTHAMGLVRADLATRGGRSVVAAHTFAAGVEPTAQLERDIQQGGVDVVPLRVFDGIDVVALGHIHGRARLSDTVRYAGSPLHYSFGEEGKPRGSWLIDLDASGATTAEWLELPVPRRVVTLTATLDELETSPDFADSEDAWVNARYTDQAPETDVMRRLRHRFPFCARVEHAPLVRAAVDERSYARRVRAARDDLELVDAFLEQVRNGVGAADEERSLIGEVVEEVRVRESRA